MTFFALLTKEMRLRMRQERTVWVLIIYVLLLGLLGWFYLSRSTSNGSSISYDWNAIGTTLYQLLTLIQIVLTIFITPAFTSGAVNAEKELKTYDMLLCSQISSFSLVAGKLIAGLSNVLLLIIATIPLFSLVFFFGGFTPLHILQDLAVFVITAAMIASFALLCSTLFAKRAVSTAIAYMMVLLWLIGPFIYAYFVPVAMVRNQQMDQQYILNILVWNPLVILSLNGGLFSYLSGNYIFAGIQIVPWLAYVGFSAMATLLFFLLSLCFVKPYLLSRIRARFIAYRKHRRKRLD
jgi:ABC-type transport system involved in multi-copper enzyme maturation permease subunit